MGHFARLENKIRQKGIGDCLTWGTWCYEELEKERVQGTENETYMRTCMGRV